MQGDGRFGKKARAPEQARDVVGEHRDTERNRHRYTQQQLGSQPIDPQEGGIPRRRSPRQDREEREHEARGQEAYRVNNPKGGAIVSHGPPTTERLQDLNVAAKEDAVQQVIEHQRPSLVQLRAQVAGHQRNARREVAPPDEPDEDHCSQEADGERDAAQADDAPADRQHREAEGCREDSTQQLDRRRGRHALVAGKDGAQGTGDGRREQPGSQQHHGNEDGAIAVEQGDERRSGRTRGSEYQAQADRRRGALGG